MSGKGDDDLDPKTLPDTLKVITPELVQALERQRGQVDVNILLRVIVDKTPDPTEILAYSEKALKLAEQYSDHQVKAFQRQADALVEFKLKDPDEIDKRRNNRIRRWLKGTVAVCALGGIAGAIAGGWMGAGIVITGSLATVAAIALALLAPLASGESVSSNDVVRVIAAIKGTMGTPGGEGGKGGRRKR